jgi:hypothetical protein
MQCGDTEEESVERLQLALLLFSQNVIEILGVEHVTVLLFCATEGM